MMQHPTQSLFLAAFPMGFATIVDMVVFVCVPAFGEKFTRLVISTLSRAVEINTNEAHRHGRCGGSTPRLL
jgi:hypothetical protein